MFAENTSMKAAADSIVADNEDAEGVLQAEG